MALTKDFKRLEQFLQPDPGNPLHSVDLLISLLSPVTVAAIESDTSLAASINTAETREDDAVEASIRDLSEKLDPSDPLRQAIDLVP